MSWNPLRWLLRKLPTIAIAVYVIVVLIWLANDKQLAVKHFEKFSSFNTSPEGLSLARGYLSRTKTSSVQILSRVADHTQLEDSAVVLRVAPQRTPLDRPEPEDSGKPQNPFAPKTPPVKGKNAVTGQLLTEAEENWIKRGGRLVLAIEGDYGPLSVKMVADKDAVRKVFPAFQGVTEIVPYASRVLDGPLLDKSRSLFLLDDGVLGCSIALGSGEVIVLSCPEIFQNENLAHGDHLRFLELLTGQNRPIYFDEFVHNIQTDLGAVELMARWGFGPCMLLGAAWAFVAWWRARTRLGPAEENYRDTRSEAIDLVDSLSRLYSSALPRHQAIAMYYRFLVQSVTLQTGLRGEPLKARLRELTGSIDPALLNSQRKLKDHEFKTALRALNEAYRRIEHVKL